LPSSKTSKPTKTLYLPYHIKDRTQYSLKPVQKLAQESQLTMISQESRLFQQLNRSDLGVP